MLKNKLLAALGIGLEYYDFVLFALLAEELSQKFFPTEMENSILKIFIILALGYLTRPMGGLFFGLIGDWFGRKPAFVLAMFLMAVGTAGLGLLPSYQTWGYGVTVILILLRILQGFAFGAELPGSMTFIKEHLKEENEWIQFCGWLMACTAAGALLASGVIFLCHYFIIPEQFSLWGWRIPFLLGGVLAVISFFARKHLDETPVFKAYQNSALRHTHFCMPFIHLIKNHFKLVLVCIGLIILAASLTVFGIAMPSYLRLFYHYPEQEIYLVYTIGLAWSMLVIPFIAYLITKVGIRNWLLLANVMAMITICFLFQLLKLQSFIALVLFMMLYQTLIGVLCVGYVALLPLIFPVHLRYTGVAISYNITYCFAAFTPYCITAISFSVSAQYLTQAITIFFVVISLMSLSAAYYSKRLAFH